MPTAVTGWGQPAPPERNHTMLRLQTWMTVLSAELRDRCTELTQRRKESGATTLEYVVIAAAVFLAAMGLVGIIISVITREQAKIE